MGKLIKTNNTIPNKHSTSKRGNNVERSPDRKRCKHDASRLTLQGKTKTKTKAKKILDQNNNANNKRKPSTIVQWNLCGLRGRLPELQLMSNELKPKLIALQETLFDDRKYNQLLDKRRYKWYFHAGPNPSKNGVAIAIDKSIPHKPIEIKTGLQAVACRTLGKKATTYVSLYRSITANKMTAQELKDEILNIVEQLPKPFMIMGDLNAHNTEWGSYKTDRWGRAIQEAIDEQGLVIMNNGKRTKISYNSTKLSAIDITIASECFDALKWDVDSDCRGSDHFPIIITEDNQTNTLDPKPKWNYKRANWDKFQTTLISSLSDNDRIETITAKIINAANDSIPKSKPKGDDKVPWWNSDVEKCIKDRKKALRKLKKYKHDDQTKVKLARKLIKAKTKAEKVISKAKKDSWEQFLSTIDDEVTETRVLWNKIHALEGKTKKKQLITLAEGNTITDDPGEVAHKFANYFYKQSATSQYSRDFQKEKRLKEKKILNFRYGESDKIYNQPLTLNELNDALEASDGKATGIDEISYEMLKHLPIESKLILLKEFNRIWKENDTPEVWNMGIIIPIPKDKNDPHAIQNYRPITLLSCMGKVYDRIANTRLITEIEERNLLDPNQFAFRWRMGTDGYHIEVDNTIAPAVRNQKHVECVALDLSKAYDTTWRRKILEELKRWGIEGNMIKYIESFLSNRKFQVEVGNTRSETKTQENGIPQGAVMSCTLFLIAMHSIVRKYRKSKNNIKILVYADDILIIAIGQDKKALRKTVQKIVTKINRWAELRGFTIAPHKSKLIHICRDRTRHRMDTPPVTIRGQVVRQVKSTKIIGVTLDRRYNFKQHLRDLKESVKPRCNMIKLIGGRYKGANRRTMLRVFNSLVLPKLLFASHLYSSSDQVLWKIIAPEYNQTIRSITGAYRTSRVSSILAETGAMPLEKHIKLNTVIKATRWLETNGYNHARNSPFIERANGFAVELTNEEIPLIEQRSFRGGLKWHEPKVKIDWSIKNQIKAGEQQTKAKQTALETINKYNSYNKIYTDGSVKDDETGYGISSQNTPITMKLNGMCSIFSAEGRAILKAITSIATNEQPSIIFTDSAGCLSALEKGKNQHPWIEEIHRESRSKNITLCWVPSHVGIKGNEEADKLAERGREAGEYEPQVPAQDAIHWFKTRTQWKYDHSWRREDNSFLRQTKPTTLPWTDRPKTADQRILTRLRIGHVPLSHEWRFTKEDPPKCDKCNARLTADHILRFCPEYEEGRIKHNIKGICAYNNTKENEDNILAFFKEYGLLNKL